MIRATLTALAIILPGTALADMPLSEDVTIERPGQDVIGTLVLPTVENPPVVLLLHGFTGSRDELATEAVPMVFSPMPRCNSPMRVTPASGSISPGPGKPPTR
jgi:hypothetical protein